MDKSDPPSVSTSWTLNKDEEHCCADKTGTKWGRVELATAGGDNAQHRINTVNPQKLVDL